MITLKSWLHSHFWTYRYALAIEMDNFIVIFSKNIVKWNVYQTAEENLPKGQHHAEEKLYSGSVS